MLTSRNRVQSRKASGIPGLTVQISRPNVYRDFWSPPGHLRSQVWFDSSKYPSAVWDDLGLTR